MPKLKCVLPGIGMVLVLTAVLLAARSPYAADDLADRIDRAKPEGFSGQIAIGTTDLVLFSKSYGLADREEGTTVTNDMLFDVGSITKTYTATAILMLVDRGSVRVEQTLGDFLHDLPPGTAAITLHELLTHTSGLPQYSGDDDEPCDAGCFDAWLAGVELEYPPGTKYQYSNPGYSALARITEIISGEPYETFLQNELAEKLQLGDIGYKRLPESAEYATGYLDGKRIGKPRDLGWMEDGPPWHLRGNGGLLTNAEGLLRWLQATAGGRTVSAELQQRQFTRHAGRGENRSYGYGWVILDQPWGTAIDHTGGNGFFFADARWIRDRDLMIAITNNAFDRHMIRQLLSDLRLALELTAETDAP